MSEPTIRFAPDILRRLGEELNPTSYQGILELVKNAYDADAGKCTIELLETDSSGGTLIVADDGNGMDDEQITESWLVLGRSEKSSQKTTEKGRTASGNKGLGRLAALRMGVEVILETRPKEHPKKQYRLTIDWDDYTDVKHVEDVSFKIEATTVTKGAGPGTKVIIKQLRQSITRLDVKKLARELLLLADPFEDNPDAFVVSLIAPEYKDLEELVKKRYFDDAEFRLTASVNSKGEGAARVVDWKGRTLYQATHKELAASRKGASYDCPPLEFNLWVYLLDGDTFATRTSSVSEVREWLKTFGGVHLYQNKLRVSPYGDPGNDWLDINLQRARSPEERPSTNTVIGRIEVHDKSELLVQKTDRSGFIETEPFLEIRAFARDALDWMARRRLDTAQKRRAQMRASILATERPSKRKLDDVIAKAPQNIRPQLKKASEVREKDYKADLDRLRKEIQLYRTLSTAGITAATFAHESEGNPIKVITHSIKAVERRGKEALKATYEKILRSPVDAIQKAVRGLAVLGTATLKLLQHEKRRTGRTGIHKIIREVVETFEPFTAARDVSVLIQLDSGDPHLHCSEAAIESIVTNLLNNSLNATEISGKRDRTISITTKVADGNTKLIVKDNGNGISGVDKADIWLPGVTTRPNGTGLGLTIVRDTVSDLGGTVEVSEKSDLGGAEFTINIPTSGD